MAISIDELSHMIADFEGQVRFCGDGYPLVSHLSKLETSQRLTMQSASSVALVAEKLYSVAPDRSVFTSANLNPTYLRKPQAEREREERLKAEGKI